MFSASVEVLLTHHLPRGGSRAAMPTSCRSSICSTRWRTTTTASASSAAMRRRSAEAAAGSRRLPERRRSSSRSAARARADTDGGVPPRAADRGAARAERAAAGGPGRRHLRGHPAAAQDARRAAAGRPGRHAARRARVHLARHLESAGRRRAGVRGARREPRGEGDEGSGDGARSAVGVLLEPDRRARVRVCSTR